MVRVICTAMKMPANWTDIRVPETTLFNSGGNHSAGRKTNLQKKYIEKPTHENPREANDGNASGEHEDEDEDHLVNDVW